MIAVTAIICASVLCGLFSILYVGRKESVERRAAAERDDDQKLAKSLQEFEHRLLVLENQSSLGQLRRG